MSVDRTALTPDGPWTEAHKAALAEWSRLWATGALPEPADEQVTVGPAVLRHQFGGYPGPGIGGRPYARRLVRCLVRFVGALALTALVLLYLLLCGAWESLRPVRREAREAALLTLGMLALRRDSLRARPGPALVALGLVAAALIAGWVRW